MSEARRFSQTFPPPMAPVGASVRIVQIERLTDLRLRVWLEVPVGNPEEMRYMWIVETVDSYTVAPPIATPW